MSLRIKRGGAAVAPQAITPIEQATKASETEMQQAAPPAEEAPQVQRHDELSPIVESRTPLIETVPAREAVDIRMVDGVIIKYTGDELQVGRNIDVDAGSTKMRTSSAFYKMNGASGPVYVIVAAGLTVDGAEIVGAPNAQNSDAGSTTETATQASGSADAEGGPDAAGNG